MNILMIVYVYNRFLTCIIILFFLSLYVLV